MVEQEMVVEAVEAGLALDGTLRDHVRSSLGRWQPGELFKPATSSPSQAVRITSG